MIKPVGASAGSRIDGPRTPAPQPQRTSAPEKAVQQDTAGTVALKVAAQVAGAGPPIDPTKVAALRAAIEEGRYTLDPDAIAARMIALDLPQAKPE